jgi:hypothetical protein
MGQGLYLLAHSTVADLEEYFPGSSTGKIQLTPSEQEAIRVFVIKHACPDPSVRFA